MRQNPSIGVCIPTRNQSEFVTDALSSAFAQTVLPVDVVVSDDAGTDDTAKVVEQFRATLPPELSARLRYSRSQEPLGIGGNFDRAVRLAAGDFVVKLDSDDILEPDFIKILADQLEANCAGWAHIATCSMCVPTCHLSVWRILVKSRILCGERRIASLS